VSTVTGIFSDVGADIGWVTPFGLYIGDRRAARNALHIPAMTHG